MWRNVKSNYYEVANYAGRFPGGNWSFLGPGSEKKSYGTLSDKPDGIWDKTGEKMKIEFSETAHLIFRASSAFETGELRSKEEREGRSTKTIHFNGTDQNVELILRTVISANPLSI